MMHNIKLVIEYDGTNYCGWQTQGIAKHNCQRLSIQQAIEDCLKKILKERVNLTASGRTDSGVHSFGQVANFKTQSQKTPQEIKSALNGNLPTDIRISSSGYIALEFHAQYHAKSKVYRYFILNQDFNSPFLKDYAYWLRFPLDIKLMQKAAVFLIGRHDFKAFCSTGSKVKDTTRTIKRIIIKPLNILTFNPLLGNPRLFRPGMNGDLLKREEASALPAEQARTRGSTLICIEIEADGFLYNMVRNIVGTLIEVGRKRFKPEYIKEILKTKNRALVGPCVPAKGLYLVTVKY